MYQIVYSKSGYPLTTWCHDIDAARKTAENLRRVGYSVTVWLFGPDGSRKTSI